MTVPAPRGELDPTVLAAARLAGVDRIWSIGGAQAVAALAWGTQSIPAVDKIVGPGNAYVAAAKRLVFGRVGIDSVAGPSEILVIADGTTPPDWVAADLCSQAEHDEHARATLVCPVPVYLDTVEAELRAMVPRFARAAIIRASLERTGALVLVRDSRRGGSTSRTSWPRSIWSCPWRSPPRSWTGSAMREPCFSEATPPRCSVTTARGRTTSFRPAARRGSRRRSAYTTSRNA